MAIYSTSKIDNNKSFASLERKKRKINFRLTFQTENYIKDVIRLKVPSAERLKK